MWRGGKGRDRARQDSQAEGVSWRKWEEVWKSLLCWVNRNWFSVVGVEGMKHKYWEMKEKVQICRAEHLRLFFF